MKGYEGSGKQVGQRLWTADSPAKISKPKICTQAGADASPPRAENNVEGRRPETFSKLDHEPLFNLLCVRGYTVLIMQHAHMQIVPIIHRLFRQNRNLRRPHFL